MISDELWIPIKHDARYEISNLGNFRKNGNPITISNHSAGYKQVKIARKSFVLHRLIAIAFIPNPENKRTVNHKNGIKDDNRIENLEWMTYSENTSHAFQCLNRRNKRKYSPVIQISLDGFIQGVFESAYEASKITGLLKSSIQLCVRGITKKGCGFIWR